MLSDDNDSQKWCIQDCMGCTFYFISQILMTFGLFTFCYFHLLPLNGEIFKTLNFILVIILYILCVLFHYKAMTTNPGTLKLNTFKLDDYSPVNIPKFCAKCNCIKLPRSHHCSVCKRCIKKMDHHCPWINNCVGQNNLRYFLLFCMYIFLYSFQVLIYFAFKFFKNVQYHLEINMTPTGVICSIILGFLAFVFALFTIIMFFTQLCNISDDTTGIERLKKEKFENDKSLMQKITETFGEKFSYRWFLPINPPYSLLSQTSEFTV